MLRSSSVGFGSLALASLLSAEGQANQSPLAARKPHFAPKAKRVIFMFMHGGPSQVDTFDYKPDLQKNDGKPSHLTKCIWVMDKANGARAGSLFW